jgi:hypothetical protein
MLQASPPWIGRASAFCIALIVASAGAAAAATVEDPYAPLVPLIGEWNVGPDGGAPAFVQRFSWGPGRAYVWAEVALIRPQGEEHLHFEGMVIWNAATRRFDYLFAVEPGSQFQEQGEFWVDGNGEIVRDVVLTAADGKTARFKQTFSRLEADRVATALLRQTAEGWTPTFPGSDKLVMVRIGRSP